MNDTPQHDDRQDSGIFISRTRVQHTLAYGVILVVALIAFAVWSAQHPAPPAGQWQGAPDPPMVDNSVKVEILSNNQLFSNNCFGSCSK